MMPSVHDWRMTPLREVGRMFDAEVGRRGEGGGNRPAGDGDEAPSWKKSVKRFFAEKLERPGWRTEIPDLDVTPNHQLVDGQLVRFTGMIQDMFDPEFYFSEFKIRDFAKGSERIATGMYRDFADRGPKEEILHETGVTEQREMCYCISVPGEAAWVKAERRKASPAFSVPSVSNPVRSKRPIDEDDDDVEEDENVDVINKPARKESSEDAMEVDDAPPGDGKKPRADAGGTAEPGSSLEVTGLNLPIPGSRGQAVIVKLYDVDKETFSLNDVVEFVGVVSLDPSLAQMPLEGSDDVFARFDRKELAARNPPASLVPRLHVLHHVKLPHTNPLLPARVDVAGSAVREEAARCREELHSMLTRTFLGDELVADYVISHLISRVYTRKDVFCLGKLSLNVFNVPTGCDYAKRVSAILQLLLTGSHYLPLTVDNLNKLNYVPKKDYHANRLVSGLLQLPAGTHLMLDETTLENGRLDPDGVRNLTAIGNTISWQVVKYNFNYHQLEFDADIPCLVFSEGRSMLPSDVQIMLKPVSSEASFVEESLRGVGDGLNGEFLNRIRKYLTVMRLTSDCDLAEDMQKEVQEDFVNERRAQQNGNRERVVMTTDDLHAHLVLAKSIGISRGESTLTKSAWDKTKSMERSRRERVAHLPPQRQPQAAGVH